MNDWAEYDPNYLPRDITPSELLTFPGPNWAADKTPDPRYILNWHERIENALIPFVVIDGIPYNPAGRTGKSGRNLGKWGENQAADPIVIAGYNVLLIQRDDCGEWAIPGGMVDLGEFAKAALIREMKEETGVDLTKEIPVILDRRYIDDPRNSDYAWITSTVALFDIGRIVPAKGADDALDAEWFDFSSMSALESDIQNREQGKLYEAHRPLLTLAKDYMEV